MNRSILCVCALLGAVCLSSNAHAGVIFLSLNLEFNTLGDLNSGGIWTAVAKAEERGIAGLKMSFVESTLNFNPSTGFLTPSGFEVEASAIFGSRLEILQADDLTGFPVAGHVEFRHRPRDRFAQQLETFRDVQPAAGEQLGNPVH